MFIKKSNFCDCTVCFHLQFLTFSMSDKIYRKAKKPQGCYIPPAFIKCSGCALDGELLELLAELAA